MNRLRRRRWQNTAMNIAMNGTLLWSCLMAATCCTAAGPETLSDFRSAGFASQYGAVSRIQFQSEPVELDGSLAHHPHGAMKLLPISPPVWVVGYKTISFHSRARTSSATPFFGDQKVDQRQDREIKGIYSDAFTTESGSPTASESITLRTTICSGCPCSTIAGRSPCGSL